MTVQGRDGKGAIYVFAGGNGKGVGDNCACDGYVSSIYTIAVASCDDNGHVTDYSERCSSIITTAYSGSGLEKNIVSVKRVNSLSIDYLRIFCKKLLLKFGSALCQS